MSLGINSDYSNAKFLEAQFKGMWNEVWKEHPGNSRGKAGVGTPRVEARRCSQLYNNAKTQKLSFVVLGETSIRQDETLLKNLGTISTNPVMSKKIIKKYLSNAFQGEGTQKINKLTREHLMKGAVLNEGNWFILPNDMVMLGVIHSGKECHIATNEGKIPSKDTLWDDKEMRPRVLGRELLQLYDAGYRIVQESLLEGRNIVMMRVDTKTAQEADLKGIRDSVKETSFKNIQDIFSDTVPFRDTERGRSQG